MLPRVRLFTPNRMLSRVHTPNEVLPREVHEMRGSEARVAIDLTYSVSSVRAD